jgi:hypothetical protein
MGIIYLVCVPSGKKYVGQHKTNDIEKRKKSHFQSFKAWKKSNKKTGCMALYNAFNKYEFKKCIWVLLEENIPLERLNEIEDSYILELNTLAPSGYNLKLNHSDEYKVFSEETLNKMSISQSKVYETNLHKYRKKHKELEEVPQFVTYFESGGIRGYRIVNHPNCKSKQFADEQTPVEELKTQTLEFLEKCNKVPYKTLQQVKKEKGIPKGISEQKPGRFLVQFRYKGIKYDKYFSQSPRDEALNLATKWMNLKKDELKEKIPIGTADEMIPVVELKKQIPEGIFENDNGYKAHVYHKGKVYTKSFSKSTTAKEENLRLSIEWKKNKKYELDNNIISDSDKLPNGISDKPNGYRVQYHHQGKNYTKLFTKSKNSKEQNLQLSIEWLQNLKTLFLLKNKEDGSETK